MNTHPTGHFTRRAGAFALLCLSALGACTSSPKKLETIGSSDSTQMSVAYDSMLEAQDADRRKRPEEAIALYRAGLEKYREFPAGWNNLGVLLMDEGRYLEASECFNAAANLAPKDPRPPYNMALAWDRAGYLDDAFEQYERAIERDPQYLPALRGSIRAERLLGRGSTRTLERLRTALSLEQDPKWRDWMELQRLRLETQLSKPGAAHQPMPLDRIPQPPAR